MYLTKCERSGFISGESEVFYVFPSYNCIASNYPNPFSDFTRITIVCDEMQDADYKILNSTGIPVKSTHTSKLQAGKTEIIWDGTNNEGEDAQAGVYYFLIENKNQLVSKPLKMLKY